MSATDRYTRLCAIRRHRYWGRQRAIRDHAGPHITVTMPLPFPPLAVAPFANWPAPPSEAAPWVCAEWHRPLAAWQAEAFGEAAAAA